MTELKPNRFICNKCNISYPMGQETTLHLYRKQAWFNHLVTNCVKCGREYTIWYITPAAAEYMAQHNMAEGDAINWRMADYCDDIKVLRAFCLDNNKPMPEDLYLSARRIRQIDTQVAWFAYLLDKEA